LGAKKTGNISRRDFIRRLGMVGFASGLGLNIILPVRTYPAGEKLTILQWAHTDSKFNFWFINFCDAWGKQNRTEVDVHFTAE